MLLRSDIQGIMKLIADEFRICIELYNGESGLNVIEHIND